MNSKNYKSIRIKNETYKSIKLLAIELDIPVTRVLDILYESYLTKNEGDKE